MRGLLASLALLACAPAGAADVAELDCTLNGLSAEQRTALGAAVAEIRLKDEPASAVFTGSLDRCARDFAWSQTEREMARRFGLAALGLETMRRGLSGEGVDVAAIERLVLADDELAAAMRAATFAEENVQAFARRNFGAIQLAAGRNRGNQELMRRIGRFVAARAILEAARLSFGGG